MDGSKNTGRKGSKIDSLPSLSVTGIMDAISQRTRSRKGVDVQGIQEIQETQETQQTQEKTGYETDVADIADMTDEEDTEGTEDTEDTPNTMEITQTQWDYGVRDSMDDRMDNYVSSMLYTAIHYPRFFVAVWVLVFVALSVLAASTQKRHA